MDNMNNQNVDANIDTLATEVTDTIQTNGVAIMLADTPVEIQAVETEEMYTKAQMQKYHSEKMNGFLKKLGANSIDEINTRRESLETTITNMTKENEELRNNITQRDERDFLNSVGVSEEVKDDFKLLFDKRMVDSPDSDKVEVAKDIVAKYFTPQPTKIGVEQKQLETDITPGLSKSVLDKYGLK